jgi:hypothetical protein
MAGLSERSSATNGAVLAPGPDQRHAAIEAARLTLKHNYGWLPSDRDFSFAELSGRPPRRLLDAELVERCGGARSYYYRDFLGRPVAVVSIFRLWHAHAGAEVEVLAAALGLCADPLPGRWNGCTVVWRRR